jgi:hypothetical protein
MSEPRPFSQRLRGITIEPPPHAWENAVRGWWNDHPNQDRTEFRRQLGLPIDQPIIMTGHQAEFWHPGIVSKYIAANAAADRIGAAVSVLVVDQDANPPADIRYPDRDPKTGALIARTWNALPGASALAERGVPLGSIPAESPAPPPQSELDAGNSSGLTGIHASLRAHAGATSVAEQVVLAAIDRLGDVTPLPNLVYAGSLARTSLFASLTKKMLAAPRACVEAYNAAVAAYPAAGMKPLDAGDDPELPLWFLPPSPLSPRRRARASMLAASTPEAFVPRALLMTALLRLAGCDLFIHGLGGGIYDPVTEHWIRHWLGASLAPVAVVTATLTLPLGADLMPPEEIDRAQWLAHHARHDPSVFSDHSAVAEKQRLLARIRELKRAGESPWSAFTELHALLDRMRTEHAERLGELRAEASAAASRRSEAAVLYDRAWPFPLYPKSDLSSLAVEIRRLFDHSV